MKSPKNNAEPAWQEIAVLNPATPLEKYQPDINMSLTYLDHTRTRVPPTSNTFIYIDTLLTNMVRGLDQWGEARSTQNTENLEKARFAVLGYLGLATWMYVEGAGSLDKRKAHLDMAAGVGVGQQELARVHAVKKHDHAVDEMDKWSKNGILYTLQKRPVTASQYFTTVFMPGMAARGAEIDISNHETIFPYIANKY